jgi:hypothetical protein
MILNKVIEEAKEVRKRWKKRRRDKHGIDNAPKIMNDKTEI